MQSASGRDDDEVTPLMRFPLSQRISSNNIAWRWPFVRRFPPTSIFSSTLHNTQAHHDINIIIIIVSIQSYYYYLALRDKLARLMPRRFREKPLPKPVAGRWPTDQRCSFFTSEYDELKIGRPRTCFWHFLNTLLKVIVYPDLEIKNKIYENANKKNTIVIRCVLYWGEKKWTNYFIIM